MDLGMVTSLKVENLTEEGKKAFQEVLDMAQNLVKNISQEQAELLIEFLDTEDFFYDFVSACYLDKYPDNGFMRMVYIDEENLS